MPKAQFGLLKKHIAKEFLLSFLVSFVFFFFIFFINQILLLVQKILLKNVDFLSMFKVVSLAIPQFLIYTIPFASLAASCMTLGDLSSYNELLALQSSGISIKHVYRVLLFFGLLLSLVCYLITDFLQPWSAVKYQDLLSTMMGDIPTFELKSNSINRVDNIVLSVGAVEDNIINDVIILDESSKNTYNKSVVADKGEIKLIDPFNFIYELKLENPKILLTETSNKNYSYINSTSAEYYLNFSNQIPSLISITPNNMSSKDLSTLIEEKRVEKNKSTEEYNNTTKLYKGNLISLLTNYDLTSNNEVKAEINEELVSYKDKVLNNPINFFFQYYVAELNKKFALSLSCLALILVSLSLATFKIKYGRLFGFGIALLLAVCYWYMLFTSQLFVFKVNFYSGLLMWIPNAFMVLLGTLMLYFTRKRQ